MPELTSSQRSLRAQIAGNTRWAGADQAERSANARRGQAGLLAKLEREVDPAGVLPPAELAKRVENARRAHMARLALASSRARSRQKGGGDGTS